MKILLVSNIFPPGFIGGYELGAYDVLRDLVKRGHDVKVLTSDYYTDELGELSAFDVERSLVNAHLSHEIIDPQTMSLNSFFINYINIRKIGSALRSFKPDVVILFNLVGLGVLSVIQFLERVRIPTLLYLMDDPFREIDLESAAYKHYVRIFGEINFSTNIKIVAMSHSLVNEVFSTIGAVADDIAFIPGWIDPSCVTEKLARNADEIDIRFVFSSNIAPHKGTEILIDATELLLRNGVTSFIVDVYGSGCVAQFLQTVSVKGLDRHIHYRGCKSKVEMINHFAEYDTLLFPTWEREPFGFVVSEAASVGCFPIMTAGIGASEWFRDGVDCMMIQRNPEALMDAMRRTILMTCDERKKLKSAAMKSARESFDSAKWMSVIEELCSQVLHKSQLKEFDVSRQIQSAFLFLGDMWREALDLQMVPMTPGLPTKNAGDSFSAEIAAKTQFENFLWKYGMRHARVLKKIPLISEIAEKYYFKLIGKR